MSIFYFRHCWVIFSINCFQKLFQSSIISNLQKFNGEDSQFHTVQTHYRWNFNLLLQKLQHSLHKISLNSLLPQLKSHLVNKDTTTSCECNEMAVACISLGISNFYSKNGCFWLLYLHYLLPHLMPFGIWTHVNVVTFGELSLCNCRIDTHTSLLWQHKKSQPCLSNYFWSASLLRCQYVTDIEQRATFIGKSAHFALTHHMDLITKNI